MPLINNQAFPETIDFEQAESFFPFQQNHFHPNNEYHEYVGHISQPFS